MTDRNDLPSLRLPVARPPRNVADLPSTPDDDFESSGSGGHAAEVIGLAPRYTMTEKIATGGMAEVFLATQHGPLGFTKTVVVKRLLPHLATQPRFVRMFINEARVAALINHPNVVAIHELVVDEKSHEYFIAMEHLDGCDLVCLGRTVKLLEQVTQRSDPRSYGVWARAMADVCAGLDYAHNLKSGTSNPLGIVHRDVSLANVFVTYDGRVKVLDFGVAKADGIDGLTKAGEVKGKFDYMSPEQFRGQPIDRRSDVWGAGVCLFRLCAGVRPFPGRATGELIQRVLYEPPRPLLEIAPQTPPELARIAMKALSKDPKDRYQSAAAMGRELEAWLRAENMSVGPKVLADFVAEKVPKTGTDIPDHDSMDLEREFIEAPAPTEEVQVDDLSQGSAPRATVKNAGVAPRLIAFATELAAMLAILRFTYQLIPSLPFVGFLIFSTAWVRTWGATPGQWLMRLELRARNGTPASTHRAAIRFVLQFGWLFVLSHFIEAAYGASPSQEYLGMAALGMAAVVLVGSVPALFGGRTLCDVLSGLSVVTTSEDQK
jgi:serine/threonine protein kinase